MTYRTDLEILYAIRQTDISGLLSRSALNKADKAYREGYVFDAVADGVTLVACVEEDDLDFHEVEITVEDGRLFAGCTCSDGWGNWCHHIGTVLLTWINDRETFNILRPDELEGISQSSAVDQLPESASEPTQAEMWTQEYERLLANLQVKQLRQIAQNRGITLSEKLKGQIARELAAGLANREATRAQLLQLDALSQELLAYMHLAVPPDYGVPLANIKPLVGNAPGQDTIRRKVNVLSEQGLLVSFVQRRVNYYVLPRLVRVCLASFPNVVDLYAKGSISSLDIRAQDFAALNHKLFQVWSYVAERHPKRQDLPARDPVENQWMHLEGWTHLPEEIAEVKAKGQFFYTHQQAMTVPRAPHYLGEPDRKALSDRLDSNDLEIDFYCMLLDELSAIGGEMGQPLHASDAQLQSLLNMPPDRQLSTLLQAWQATTQWSEMDSMLRAADDICIRRNVTYTTYKPEHLYEEWRESRLAVFRFLSLLKENQWFSPRSLQKTIYQVMPNLAHFLSHTGVWWLESIRRRKQFGATLDDWLASYGRLITAVVTGPLVWLGAVDLGYQDGQLGAFRLTPAGSYMLGRRETLLDHQVQLEPQQAIQLQDDLTVKIAPGRAPTQLYNLLGTIGQLESATPKHFVYRLSASSVHRQFERGESAQTILAMLEETCPVEIPASWKTRLHEWQENYGRLHLYQDITVIEFADEFILKDLMINTLLRESIIYQFSPRLIAIRPDAVDALVQEMEKQGYMPRVE